jgi:phosphoenolpyruvate synthase/pyruvate phosphate dikinase
LALPSHFVGLPTPVAEEQGRETDERAAPGAILTGIAASPGMAEGIARVVCDPSQFDNFDPDDVLVCQLTDPAWAPLLQLAAAVVIDVGGVLSHGAIVARELGIPAVIGTVDGSRRIRDGCKVRVDGSTGQVTVLCE